MNYKLEKFWNEVTLSPNFDFKNMNYKLEKFWNFFNLKLSTLIIIWTINLKSFEMQPLHYYYTTFKIWTINLKSFEIYLKILR